MLGQHSTTELSVQPPLHAQLFIFTLVQPSSVCILFLAGTFYFLGFFFRYYSDCKTCFLIITNKDGHPLRYLCGCWWASGTRGSPVFVLYLCFVFQSREKRPFPWLLPSNVISSFTSAGSAQIAFPPLRLGVDEKQPWKSCSGNHREWWQAAVEVEQPSSGNLTLRIDRTLHPTPCDWSWAKFRHIKSVTYFLLAMPIGCTQM